MSVYFTNFMLWIFVLHNVYDEINITCKINMGEIEITVLEIGIFKNT